MSALLESLLVPEGATWTYFYRRLDEAIPFNWHYHLEYELTLTCNSLGQRYVGDSIESYGDGDLALLGSNLPHTWMSQDKLNRRQPHVAHVFWIKPDWIHALIDTVNELKPLRAMFAKPIACIAGEVGYTNLSHFNRQFLAIKQQTPREFRSSLAPKSLAPKVAGYAAEQKRLDSARAMAHEDAPMIISA